MSSVASGPGRVWLRRHDNQRALRKQRKEFEIQEQSNPFVVVTGMVADRFKASTIALIDTGAIRMSRRYERHEDPAWRRRNTAGIGAVAGRRPIADLALRMAAQVRRCALERSSDVFGPRSELLGIKRAPLDEGEVSSIASPFLTAGSGDGLPSPGGRRAGQGHTAPAIAPLHRRAPSPIRCSNRPPSASAITTRISSGRAARRPG